jgi:hypothetical protein
MHAALHGSRLVTPGHDGLCDLTTPALSNLQAQGHKALIRANALDQGRLSKLAFPGARPAG